MEIFIVKEEKDKFGNVTHVELSNGFWEHMVYDENGEELVNYICSDDVE